MAARSSARGQLRRLCRRPSSRSCASARRPSRAGSVMSRRCAFTSPNGLAAARAAHLPLQAIKLRLTYVEGLHRAERMAQARAAARHLAHIRGGAVPPLLKSRIESVLERAQQAAGRARVRASRFHGVCAPPATSEDLDGLRNLLASVASARGRERSARARGAGDSPPHARARRRHLRLAATPRRQDACVLGRLRATPRRGGRSTSASPSVPSGLPAG